MTATHKQTRKKSHIRFPSIEQFNNVYHRETVLRPEIQGLDGKSRKNRALIYGAKIKLHGTQAAIRVSPDYSVVAQSNRYDLTPEYDNCEFAEWLEPQKSAWSASSCEEEIITFYGEWAGSKIAKGDAVAQIGKRCFFIFAVGVGVVPHYNMEDRLVSNWIVTDPDAIRTFLPANMEGDEVRVLPWENEHQIIFDFDDDNHISQTLEMVNRSVESLDVKDPYISRTFGIDHPGEGFVFVPICATVGDLTGEQFGRLAFKSKTDRHRVRKQGKAASAREPLPQTALEFVETFVTTARLEQAQREVCPGLPDIKKTGALIGWMIGDIKKEAAPEIEALPVDFRKLQSAITTTIREWWEEQIRLSYPAAAE